MALNRSRPPKPDRSAEFTSYVAYRPRATAAKIDRENVAREIGAKTSRVTRAARTRHDLRAAARGEECLLELPGCPRNPSKTVASHARWSEAGKGLGIKSVDAAIAFACTRCDAIYDGQAPLPEGWSRAEVDWAWCMAHLKTLVRLTARGLL